MQQLGYTLLFTCVTLVSLSACSNKVLIDNHRTNTISSKQHDLHQHSDKVSWGYEGTKGPNFWGDFNSNGLCKTGYEQSPIDIVKVEVSNDKRPNIQYKPSDLIVTNNGHTIVYTPKQSSNKTFIDGEWYTLLQFHYHTPSEHKISGVNFPAEIHFVHTNSAGDLAVIGVMLNASSSQAMYSDLIQSSQLTTNSGQPSLINAFDLNRLVPTDSNFYHYEGSLTTPPCSENVKWFVAYQPIAISSSELMTLTQLYSGNNRPVQLQGERKVDLIQ